jgi:hypothetical protein
MLTKGSDGDCERSVQGVVSKKVWNTIYVQNLSICHHAFSHPLADGAWIITDGFVHSVDELATGRKIRSGGS